MDLIEYCFTRLGWPLVKAAWWGSIAGWALLLLFRPEHAWLGNTLWETLALLAGLLAINTYYAFPVALAGLVVLGLPLAFLLRRWADRRWLALVALAAGGLAGRTFSGLVGLDGGDFWSGLPGSMGFAFGAATALLWFVFARGPLLEGRQAASRVLTQRYGD